MDLSQVIPTQNSNPLTCQGNGEIENLLDKEIRVLTTHGCFTMNSPLKILWVARSTC